jgi:hypothetical protein
MSEGREAAGPPVYTIQGRTVGLPVRVRDASSGTATYLVPSAAARRLLPGDALDVVELLPGRALLSVGAIDYRQNDLGDYNEIAIALFVRERLARPRVPYLGTLLDLARQRIATYIHRLPVNQGFTREAGCRIWGFPKTLDEIEIETPPGRFLCTWVKDGRHVFTFSVPRGGARSLPEMPLTTYSFIEGVAHRTRFTTAADGVGVRLGGAELRLGDHPIADELRALGLPRRALMTTWMEHMRASFEAPEKL